MAIFVAGTCWTTQALDHILLPQRSISDQSSSVAGRQVTVERETYPSGRAVYMHNQALTYGGGRRRAQPCSRNPICPGSHLKVSAVNHQSGLSRLASAELS